MTRTPRLRTVFALVGLFTLLLPLGGIILLRLYESALIRRTESELLVQGAVLAEAFAQQMRVARGNSGSASTPVTELAPAIATLDLTIDPLLPTPAPARSTTLATDAIAATAGAHLSEILTASRSTTLAATRITDRNGIVVASSSGDLGLSLAHYEEVRGALGGESVRSLRERRSDEPSPALDSLSRTTRLRVFVSLPVRDHDAIVGAVLLSRTPMSVGQSLYGIRWHIATAAAILLGVIVLVSIFTSRTVTRPLQELIARADRVAAGEPGVTARLARPGTHEVAQLADAVAAMASTLERRAEYIQSFAASVSHEFKTPLTSIRGAVELFRDHYGEMSPDERDRFLVSLDQNAVRLERLVRRMLELARADMARPAGESSRWSDIANRLRDRYGNFARLQISGDDLPPLRIASDTLETILVNLIDNSRVHGGSEVAVTIRASLLPRGDRRGVAITVTDDGAGISEANLARIFDPFFTTARATGGTGLGLAIVRTLLDAHSGTIGVTSRPRETTFDLWLPVKSRQ